MINIQIKRTLIFVLAFSPLCVLAQKSNFTLKGKIGNFNQPATAYLTYYESDKAVNDSAILHNGMFQFSGQVSGPVNAQLRLAHTSDKRTSHNDTKWFYIEKGLITMNGKDSVKTAEIAGSKVNADNEIYKKMTAGVRVKLDKINDGFVHATPEQRKNEDFINASSEWFEKVQEEQRIIQRQYVEQNPNSYISLQLLTELDRGNVLAIEPLYRSLSAAVRNTPAGKALAAAIDVEKKTGIGATAPVFTENDVNSKPVSLADFRGYYVLLDFWASWCAPCRAENPFVKKAYHTYKNKKFTVLSVSLDRPGNKAAWLAAINADGLEWTQVSDLKFFDSEAVKLYGIHSIPQNFLIDPSGKIIAKNLRGDDLDKKLATLFN